jgi:hypothetical protein
VSAAVERLKTWEAVASWLLPKYDFT